MEDTIMFIDNAAVKNNSDRYVTVTVDVAKILKSWRQSLFAFEWMLPDGGIKSAAELSAAEQTRRTAVEEQLKKNTALEKPVLGIGLLDNVEIGAGRAVFLTLAASGAKKMPVHIPKSSRDEFAKFMA